VGPAELITADHYTFLLIELFLLTTGTDLLVLSAGEGCYKLDCLDLFFFPANKLRFWER